MRTFLVNNVNLPLSFSLSLLPYTLQEENHSNEFRIHPRRRPAKEKPRLRRDHGLHDCDRNFDPVVKRIEKTSQRRFALSFLSSSGSAQGERWSLLALSLSPPCPFSHEGNSFLHFFSNLVKKNHFSSVVSTSLSTISLLLHLFTSDPIPNLTPSLLSPGFRLVHLNHFVQNLKFIQHILHQVNGTGR